MSSFKSKTPSLPSQAVGASVDRDQAVTSNVTDTISTLRWSPVASYLAASSWDGKVHIYDVANDLTAKGVGVIDAGSPVFTCDWNQDGTIVAGAGAGKKVYLLSAATGQATSFIAHDAPIRSLRFVKVPNAPLDIIVTGSWDKTVRYWDVRNTGSPLATLTCKERVYSMDAADGLLVIATADRHIQLVDLKADPNNFKNSTTNDPLKHQTHVVTAFPDGKGYAVGSIEGRAGIKMFPETSSDKSHSFTFRCHRHEAPAPKGAAKDVTKTVDVWAVNDINFHPVHTSIFTTAGSDGCIYFWDRLAHARFYTFPQREGAISASAFSRDGRVFAYAVGYDWAMGYAKNSPTYPLKLMLHPVADEEVKPRKG